MRRRQIAILLLLTTACARFGPAYDGQITSATLALDAFDALDEELEVLAAARGAEEASESIALAKNWAEQGRAALKKDNPRRAAMYLERIRSQLDLIGVEIGKAQLQQKLACELQRQTDLAKRVKELEQILNRDERSPSTPKGDS